MSRVALILEGPGDLEAFPTLVAKTGSILGLPIFAHRPIRTGGYPRLAQPGQIERYVVMAASRPDIDAVLIAVDLDDGCPVDVPADFRARAEAAAAPYGKRVGLCFCIREYECWLLEELDNLRATALDYDWDPDFACENPSRIRGAKEALQKAIRKNYKETTDQLALTKKLDLLSLFGRSRSYRKFCKELTGLSYDELQELAS